MGDGVDLGTATAGVGAPVDPHALRAFALYAEMYALRLQEEPTGSPGDPS